jgi:hypothetical protein
MLNMTLEHFNICRAKFGLEPVSKEEWNSSDNPNLIKAN